METSKVYIVVRDIILIIGILFRYSLRLQTNQECPMKLKKQMNLL